ncbi:MAG: cyclic pyranopterin monophosphate synthase MoaC [Ferruginibacter sp.]|nr:cyclic pyranopterin monophosphate synthase MoaC [Ferruginibacter sp.]
MKKSKNILSHINAAGNPQMADVSEKLITFRTATAQATVQFPLAVFKQLQKNNFLTAKGSIFHTAIIAGTMAAKCTAALIPLCHPLALSQVTINIETGKDLLVINATIKCEGKTGVEMEALTAVSIAALTVYDMCKALSHDIIITQTKLIAKKGGESDFER